jgi:hypothetical protein
VRPAFPVFTSTSTTRRTWSSASPSKTMRSTGEPRNRASGITTHEEREELLRDLAVVTALRATSRRSAGERASTRG